MSAINSGGPAFPCNAEYFSDGTLAGQAAYGMTLRDYFAGQWLTTFKIAAPGIKAEDIAKQAYAVADAMLRAREAA